jgi:hypothetical protein
MDEQHDETKAARARDLIERMESLSEEETAELASYIGLDKPRGVSMGCDFCYQTLYIGDVSEWPTTEEAVAAAHSAGWTGNAWHCLCAACAAIPCGDAKNGGAK